MLFNSSAFLCFFIIVTTAFFLLPHRARWALLLGASCFFYMFFKPEYILILFFTIVIDYFAGIWLEKIQDKKKKKWFLVLSIVANVGVLVIFKYYNFLNDNLTGLCTLFGVENPVPYFDIVLPIGLSFHTFQAMSYTIEVYRGKVPAEKHFGIYSLYVMFYPQLVAGPIERPQNILHQFHEKKYFSFENAGIGLNLIFLGLFKKVVVADRLAIYVDEVYAHLETMNSFSAIIAVIFFSFQIYCDFSGYSDIARGTAKFMGYDLMVNFRQPYLSSSISEFWTRWHISLSTWFKDYVYIPLGGNRRGNLIKYRNLMVVFLISRIWHGASWTFVIWGCLHALFVVAEGWMENSRISLPKLLGFSTEAPLYRLIRIGFIFMLVSFAWIFFRAESFDQALAVISKIGAMDFTLNLPQVFAYKGPLNMLLSLAAIGLLLMAAKLPHVLEKRVSPYFLVTATVLIIFLGTNESAQFIYFQF